MRLHKDKIITFFFFVVIFIASYCYFRFVAPIVFADSDDWYNIIAFREPWPTISQHNPIKVLPELLYPLCGRIGGYLIYPFTGDFTVSMSIVTCTVVSSFLVLYLFAFYKLLCIKCAFKSCYLLTTTFLLLHLLVYGGYSGPCQTMFYSWDMTCYFHYTIPNLLNGALVMFAITYDVLDTITVERYWKRNCMFVVALYFAMCSCIFCDVIFFVYCIIHGFEKVIDSKQNWRYRLKIIAPELIILVCAVGILWMESHGPRTSEVHCEVGMNYYEKLVSASWLLSDWYLISLNRVFQLSVCVVVLFYIIKKGDIKNLMLHMVLPYILCSLYVYSICMVSKPNYLGRTDVMFASLFYLLLFCVPTVGHYTQKGILSSVICALLCLAAVIKPYITEIQLETYNYWKNFNGLVINQIDEAISIDKDDVTIMIPKYPANNWPLLSTVGRFIPVALYKNGIISKEIKATTVIDDNNQRE